MDMVYPLTYCNYEVKLLKLKANYNHYRNAQKLA